MIVIELWQDFKYLDGLKSHKKGFLAVNDAYLSIDRKTMKEKKLKYEKRTNLSC